MSEHSPEPWQERADGFDGIEDAENMSVDFEHPTSDDGHRCTDRCRGYLENEAANRARAIACVNACRGLNPECVPELVACLKSLLCSHQELLERCLLHDAFLNHAQQLNAGVEGIRAKELLARVKT